VAIVSLAENVVAAFLILIHVRHQVALHLVVPQEPVLKLVLKLNAMPKAKAA
jgi:hypothetical protein